MTQKQRKKGRPSRYGFDSISVGETVVFRPPSEVGFVVPEKWRIAYLEQARNAALRFARSNDLLFKTSRDSSELRVTRLA